MAWCFDDERTAQTDALLRRLANSPALVPQLWPLEVAKSEDPTEWDAFRTAVLEKQGWKLHHLWTPHFFRDPKGR